LKIRISASKSEVTGEGLVKDDLNPQAREMADESMVRNLAAQAEAIWPQEKPLFDRYRLPTEANVLDAGCGTGRPDCGEHVDRTRWVPRAV
jgi:hypothetical protein